VPRHTPAHTHCLGFARNPLSRMKINTKCFADVGTGLPHHKSMQSKGPKNRWAPRTHIYLLLGCTAQPSNSLKPLNYRCLFFPMECRFLPSLKLHLPYILLYIFQPSHSRSSLLLLPSGLLSNIFLTVFP
jgi:hypothetical protein